MQTLKDAMVLLGALLLIASVRVSRIEPVNFDLVPAAHAASAESKEPAASSAQPIEVVLPAALPALNAQTKLETLTVEPRVLRSCETKVFRFTTDSAQREVLAIAIETSPKPKATPRACKIG